MDDKVRKLITETLERSKNNPDTADCVALITRLQSMVARYKAMDLFTMPEKRANWIRNQIALHQSTLKVLLLQLNRQFMLEDEITEKGDFIAKLTASMDRLVALAQFEKEMKEAAEESIDVLLEHCKNLETKYVALLGSSFISP